VTPAAFEELTASLRGIPELADAACRNRSDLFDTTDEIDAERPINICNNECSARQACADWLASLPPNSVNGVVAGELHVWVSHPSLRRRKAAS
jgi:hypothetical protein